MQVWALAQVKQFADDGWATDWDLGGVFTSEAAARAACTDVKDCIWPMTLDEPIPRERIEPAGLTFPLAR